MQWDFKKKLDATISLYKRSLCLLHWSTQWGQVKEKIPKFCPDLYDSAKQSRKTQSFRTNPFISYDLGKLKDKESLVSSLTTE